MNKPVVSCKLILHLKWYAVLLSEKQSSTICLKQASWNLSCFIWKEYSNKLGSFTNFLVQGKVMKGQGRWLILFQESVHFPWFLSLYTGSEHGCTLWSFEFFFTHYFPLESLLNNVEERDITTEHRSEEEEPFIALTHLDMSILAKVSSLSYHAEMASTGGNLCSQLRCFWPITQEERRGGTKVVVEFKMQSR